MWLLAEVGGRGGDVFGGSGYRPTNAAMSVFEDRLRDLEAARVAFDRLAQDVAAFNRTHAGRLPPISDEAPTDPPTAPEDESSPYAPTAASAPSTDIYLGALALGERVGVRDVRNVTDRDGYDNQPAFLPDAAAFLYTSGRDGRQTDVYRYDVATGTSTRVTTTPESEFSPTPLPSGDGFSSIRESATGQLLWRYGLDGTSRGAIFEHVQPVGYHAWGDESRVLMFVLGGDERPATLQLGDLGDGSARVVAENPGRSLHRIPHRHAVSFVRKAGENDWWIEALDLDSGETTRLIATRPGREDYAWTPDGRIVMGDGAELFIASPGGAWEPFADLAGAGIAGVTRIAISDDGRSIAIVSERPDGS